MSNNDANHVAIYLRLPCAFPTLVIILLKMASIEIGSIVTMLDIYTFAIAS